MIIAEPGMHKITNGHKGLYRFKITVEGKAVHTGLREWEQKKKGRNVILDMVRVIECVQEIAKFLEEEGNPFSLAERMKSRFLRLFTVEQA